MKKEYKAAVGYVLLMNLAFPSVVVYAIVSFLVAKAVDSGAWVLPVFGILWLLYGIALLILGIKNMKFAFGAGRRQEAEVCVNGMLIHKYGLVAFFLINFVSLSLMYFVFLVASRGTFFMFLPITVPVSMMATYVIMIPGSVYGLQVIRESRRTGKLSKNASMWHSLFQFLFLTDVLSAMYLAVKKWNRGKKGAVVILILYLTGLLLTAYGIFKIAG